MNSNTPATIKQNVHRFDEDVRRTGSYAYTADKLSSKYANDRISSSIASCYEFCGKKILDLGCGDGTYTVEFASLGVSGVLGIDPAEAAIEAAKKRVGENGVVQFETGNIYELGEHLGSRHFDCTVLRGVLHHLPNPAEAIARVAPLADTLIILEPNGYNPVLKLLERFSQYHIEHEERSFSPSTIGSWIASAGMQLYSSKYLNLVPMFCPNWMAKLCKSMEPMVESTPILRNLACGQALFVAKNTK
jgi:SAM-dependent methyltransferase